MAERKLTKSEQALKIRDPEAFAERMKRKKGRRPLTAKTIRDAGQGKGKAAKTAMEKRADQAGKRATRQALQKGASLAKAKQAGKKAAMAVVSGSGIKTATNLGMVAANLLPVGKAIRGVGSFIKGVSKSKTPPKSTVKKTPPTKVGSKSKTPPTKVPKLSSNQKRAIKATAAVPVVLGANALLKNKPEAVKKPKPKPEAVKKPKPDLSYRDDEGSPIGTVSKKSTTTYTPRKKYEGGIDFYETPFGTIKADSSDDAFNFDVEEKDGGYLKRDMMMKKRKKGGVVKRRMGGQVRGYGKAQRGY
tara:strand:+ start:63 stop:971 length:909 start_codon:yes stop_codon:yes gene_type:complete